MIETGDPLFIFFIITLILSVIISLVLMGHVWQRRSVLGAKPLLGALLGVFYWSFGYLIEYTSTDLNTKLFSFNISYLGQVSIQLMMLLFILQYCGYGKFVTRRNVILLSIIPAITLLLQWTKLYHPFMYSNYRLSSDGPFLLVLKDYGPWFWVIWVYLYSLIGVSLLILFYRLAHRPRIYGDQIAYIVAMIAVPVLANLIYMFRIVPLPHADWTPAAFSVSTIVMTIAIYRKHLLQIIPISRESVIEKMSEGFIVINDRGFIADFNNSAQQMFPPKGRIRVGDKLPESVAGQLHFDYKTVDDKPDEIIIEHDSLQHYYLVTVTALFQKGHKHAGHLLVFHDITDRKQAEDAIKQLAYHDQLTSLPNRNLFYDRAAMATGNAARSKKKLAVMMLDIDKFKSINDSFGHEAGDQALSEVARRLMNAVRKVDTVSRFGGDEFTILLTEITDEVVITTITARIIDNMTAAFEYQGHSIKIPFSIGISIYPDDSIDLETLIRYADLAMYAVKHTRTNIFLRYSPDMDTIINK